MRVADAPRTRGRGWPGPGWLGRDVLPLVAWTALILFVATRPSASVVSPALTTALGVPRELLQYPYHLSAFFVLAALFVRSVGALGMPRMHVVVISTLGTLAISVTSEILQFWVPSRTPAARDVLLDLVGGGLAMGVMRLVGSPLATE